MTSDVVHCFCRGFEAGGGQCDPEQVSNFVVRLTSPNDYHCMLKLPQSFSENVVELMYLHHEYSYAVINLLCKVWKKMPRLETVVYKLRHHQIFLSKNDILSISIICYSLRNTKISMYARYSIYHIMLHKDACMFLSSKEYSWSLFHNL